MALGYAMKIRKAEKKDIPEILALVQAVIKDMNLHEIDQWNEQYPLPEIFISDIKAGSLFAMKDNESIVGIIVVTEVQDEEYKPIAWEDTSGKPLIIHRIAVHPERQRKGIACTLMDFAERYARDNGYSSIRIDTYSGNPRTLNLFEKRKYDRREGHIYFPECKEHYYCYEKILTK